MVAALGAPYRLKGAWQVFGRLNKKDFNVMDILNYNRNGNAFSYETNNLYHL